MPEYLAPGVFVEEVSFRQKSIEGVSTSTTGFVGPTRFGPISGEPPLLTSFADFERIYGGLDRLYLDGTPGHNYLAHAVRAYFEEGGKRLYVARVGKFAQEDSGDSGDSTQEIDPWASHASWPDPKSSPPSFELKARHPGAAGNFTVTFAFQLGENILGTDEDTDLAILNGASHFDVVWAEMDSSPNGALYRLERTFDADSGRSTFQLRADGSPATRPLADATSVRVLTVSVTTGPLGRFGDEQTWEALTFHPEHPRSLSQVFAEQPNRRSTELFVPLIFDPLNLDDGLEIAQALAELDSLGRLGSPPAIATVHEALVEGSEAVDTLTFRVKLEGGGDGQVPTLGAYEGDDSTGRKSGLMAFEDLEDISIVAAPGSSKNDGDDSNAIGPIGLKLISHCERMRYRVAVLDSDAGLLPGDVKKMRATFDSTRAALYYPWVRVFDPFTESEIQLPPSGFMAGIYARNDVERGVHKSPANEVIRLATGFELLLNKAQQETLNPAGVNCLRFFEGRGFRVWGARTASSDPEWKYLNVRRYFAFLERSVEKGTQWVVFENNGPVLWANVRSTIEDFLFNEWQSNHLLGSKPEQAFFVRCDRSTMTQNDIDNGRLICHIGVAPLRPAEFVIFRIGQKTADG